MSGPSPHRGAVLGLILAAVAWGSGTVISKRAVAEIPPFPLLTIQLAASVAALWLALWVTQRRAGAVGSVEPVPPLLARLGILNPGIAYALTLIGLTQITASLSVMLWALEPILILVLAAIVLRERIGAALVMLSAIAVAGMGLVLLDGGGSGAIQVMGVVVTVAGVACCAVYTVVARGRIGEVPATAPVVLAQQVHALVFVGVAVTAIVVATGVPSLATVSAVAWASAIASGILYYGAAYWLYLGGLRWVPASTAAVSFYLIPVVGVTLGMLLLGERFAPHQWIGAAVVVLAVAAILRSPATRPI